MSHVIAGTQKLVHLQSDLERGRIKIPQFQRDFVWDTVQVASLLDSIIRGYPIGDLIYWQTSERLREVRNLGRLNFPAPEKGERVSYVLDGQQRLTSITAALLGLQVELRDGSARDFSSLLVHLNGAEEDTPIVYTKAPDEISGTFLPLTQLWSRQGDQYDNCSGNVRTVRDEFSQRLLTYEIPKVTLKEADLAIATEVFSRINTGGQDLSLFEIMVAKTFDPDQEFDLVEKCDKLAVELKDAGFETIEPTLVLQLLALLLRDDCKKKTILSLSREEFIETWPRAIKNLKKAIDYTKVSFRIPVSRLLPYPALLIPIALFFDTIGKKAPEKRQAKLLADFFWRASWSERYSSASESKLSQDKKTVQSIIQMKRVRYEWAERVNMNYIRDATFTASGAFSKTVMALLATQQPQKYDSGDLVNLRNDCMHRADSLNFHHIFPKAHLKAQQHEDWEINRILNISLVDEFLNKSKIRDRAPSDYMKQFKEVNDDFKESMETHLVRTHYTKGNEGKSAAIWSDDYRQFIKERARDVVALMKSKLVQ